MKPTVRVWTQSDPKLCSLFLLFLSKQQIKITNNQLMWVHNCGVLLFQLYQPLELLEICVIPNGDMFRSTKRKQNIYP
jgi:hypothetical protein